MSANPYDEVFRRISEASAERNKPKAKFHGEASTREEWGYIREDGTISNWINDKKNAAFNASGLGLKLLCRTVSVSQWVEVES
jgi:hypothetical protein